jgi:hypothetical protein
MKLLSAILFTIGTSAIAQQTLTIPARTIPTTITANGATAQATITIPAQTVTLPTQGGSALPSGMTYTSAGGLNVVGPITSSGQITGTTISLTSGTALGTCTSGIYIWQMNAGILGPVCLGPITVTPALSQ